MTVSVWVGLNESFGECELSEGLPDHVPVLLEPILSWLVTDATRVYADCTAGLGGHASAVAERIRGREGAVVALNDLDSVNLEVAEASVRSAGGAGVGLHLSRNNFVAFPRTLIEAGLHADSVLADLGFSSSQMDNPERGLSIRLDGPLDMRFDPGAGRSAADLVNSAAERELSDIIKRFGEEPAARRVARAIVQRRSESRFETTGDLVSCLVGVLGRPSRGSIHPATKTFQALRIAVNDELSNLDSLLESIARAALATRNNPARSWLRAGARIGIISFHSLEDRRVKVAMKGWQDRSLGRVLTKTPVVADEGEVCMNPRSRSAKLRIFEVRGS